jgi:hypothetical protein
MEPAPPFRDLLCFASALLVAGCTLDDRRLLESSLAISSNVGGFGSTLGDGATHADPGLTPGPDASTDGTLAADGGVVFDPTFTGDGGAAGLEAGGAGGAGGGASSTGSGGRSAMGSGGAGGAAVDTDAGPTTCPDCSFTLVGNGTFDKAATQWDAETGVVESWLSRDAWRQTSSGSLSVKNTNVFDGEGWSMLASRQCIDVRPGTTYSLTVETSMVGGQGSGAAAIGAWIYDSAACTGNLSKSYTSDMMAVVDHWKTVTGTVQTPTTASSMFVRLAVFKPLRQKSFEALFDGVRVRAQ